MGLLDDAIEASKDRFPKCSVGQLPPDLLAEVEEALALLDSDVGVTGEGISKALAMRDVRLKGHTLRRHHRGDCTCELA